MIRSSRPCEHRFGSPIATVFRSLALVLTLLPLVPTMVGAKQPSGMETPAQTDRKAIECLKPGMDALKDEDLDRTVKAFADCVKKHPESGLARYWLGKAYFYQGKYAEATRELKEAARLEPNNYRPLYMLARVYSQDDKKLSLAQELLEKVVAGNPEFNEARLALAHTFVKQGDLKKAFIQFRLIFRKERDFARYHTELGRLLSALGQNKQAKEQFERALVLFPDYDRAKKYLEELRDKAEATDSRPADGKDVE